VSALPPGPFSLAYIDPPWHWRARSPRGEGRKPPYERMSLAELKALPVPSILARDAMVALWVIDTHIPQALELLEAWGLTYATVGFYWAKTTRSNRWHIGTGYYTRANPEQCWLARRGRGLPVRNHSQRRLQVAQVTDHSRKPASVRDALVTLFGDVPRVELFARTEPKVSHGEAACPRDWVFWGDEAVPGCPVVSHGDFGPGAC
jgi:N6-adenosine-specific RNA methylase IME4